MKEHHVEEIIKTFEGIIKQLEKDTSMANYYSIIVKYLNIEKDIPDIIALNNKQIYHYFKFDKPVINREYFEFLYHPYNPVRFAVETFDSIEEVAKILNRR